MTDEELLAAKRDLKKVMLKHKISLGVAIDGDTHGISTNFVLAGLDDKEHILAHHTDWIYHNDLNEDEDDHL